MWQIVYSVLFLALGLRVDADKLDQVFEPPAGAGTAGGFPGDVSAPLSPPIPIVSYENSPNAGDGSYSYSYETGNGIKASEEGAVKSVEPEGQAQIVQGVYSYTGPDGVLYTIAYTADENGFVARGDHLPTAPPIPPEILAALEQNAAEEATPGSPEAGPTTPAPAQVGYFKSLPPVYQHQNYNYNQNQYSNRNYENYLQNKYYNKYFRRY